MHEGDPSDSSPSREEGPDHEPQEAPRLSIDEMKRVPVMPGGWVDNDEKRSLALDILRDAERNGLRITQRELARELNIEAPALSRNIREWTDGNHFEKGTQAALVRVLEYFDWAKKNRVEAYALRGLSVPQETKGSAKEVVARRDLPSYADLTPTQRRIGQVCLREFRQRLAAKREVKLSSKAFLNQVADVAVVTKKTLYASLKAVGGIDHLMKLIDDEEKKKSAGA